MADATMLDLPTAVSVDGSEYAWIVQGGTDKRCTLADIANTSPAQLPQGGVTGQVLIKHSDDNYDTQWATITGVGTVTSVALALPAIFSVSGSPITSGGTLTGTLATQAANLVWAGPSTGADATPTFRSLVNADLPVVALAQGGTNANLTASNGGIFYSTGTAGAILAGIATPNRVLLSGSNSAPTWSTASYPVTAAAGRVLAAASNNAITATTTPTLGISGTVAGTLTFAGVTSGSVLVTPQAAAGTPTLTLPTASGTFAVSATAPLSLNSTTGALSITATPQNSQSAPYTLVLTDGEKQIFHPEADNNARTFTIPANASVAFPVGTSVTFINKINTVTIAITSDTLTLASAGTTGSRTLAANGIATAIKIATTEWLISGFGLT